MHARMPVHAAEENRMELARSVDVVGSIEHVIEQVRVLARYVRQRELRELRGEGGSEKRKCQSRAPG